MTNYNAVELEGFVGLVVEEIGTGKGIEAVRRELVALCGDKAGEWFDRTYGVPHNPRYIVFVRDWTGGAS